MKRLLVGLVVFASVVPAANRIYDVDVYKNVNGKASGSERNGITQIFVNTADSLIWAEFFVGALSAAGTYDFEIRESPTGTAVYTGHAAVPTQGWRYVRAETLHRQNPGTLLIKGKLYKLTITHSSGDSINYYADPNNPYPYGYCIEGGQDRPGYDLCARIEGVNRVPNEAFSVITCVGPETEHSVVKATADTMRAYGFVREPRAVFVAHNFVMSGGERADTNWIIPDSLVSIFCHDSIEPCLSLLLSSCQDDWARHAPRHPDSTHPDVGSAWFARAFRPAWTDGKVDTSNYFAEWVWKILCHYGPSSSFWDSFPAEHRFPIRSLELGGEPNLDIPTSYLYCARDDYLDTTYRRVESCFVAQDPDPMVGRKLFRDTLVARFCAVMYEVVQHYNSEHGYAIKVIAPQAGGIESDVWGNWNTKGKTFLRHFYELGGGANCDMLSVSLYQENPATQTQMVDYFDPAFFKANVDTIRSVMREHGDADKVLRISEYGFRNPDGHVGTVADAIPEAVLSAYGMGEDIANAAGELNWALFTSRIYNLADSAYAFTDGNLAATPASRTWRQLRQQANGKVLNGRVLLNDSRDDSVRVYELEEASGPNAGKKTWLCWKNRGLGATPVSLNLPAGTDMLVKTELARTVYPDSEEVSAGLDGWLQTVVDSSPVYIREAGPISRPDLKLDSIWTEPEVPRPGTNIRTWARLSNPGSDTIPKLTHSTISQIGFYANDDVAGFIDSMPNVPIGGHVDVASQTTWEAFHVGDFLFKVVANEPRTFVETLFDNNAAYRLYHLVWPETTAFQVNPGHAGQVAVTHDTLITLHSEVSDSILGPADSMRVTQSYFAPNSVNMTALDSFGWTVYQDSQNWYLNHGEGKYILNVRVWILGDSLLPDQFIDLVDSCLYIISAVPVPISPVMGAQNRPLNVELIWHSSGWQPSYDVYLGADSASLVKVDSSLTDTSYACSDLASYQTCYWRVVARYLGSEDSSEVRSFRTLITADRPLTSAFDRAARRLARNPADSSIAAAAEIIQGADTLIGFHFDCSQPDSSWFSAGEGSDPELAFASDGAPWLVYLGDHDSDLVVGCMRPDSSWKTFTVLSGSPGLKLGPPTLALFQAVSGRVAQIAVPAYDTAGSSMILFVQADTSESILDTAHYATGSFADSSSHIEASVTDSIRLVFASGDIFYRELNYEPTTLSTPDTWSKLSLVSDTLGLAGQPFCEQVGNRLYVAFRQIDNPVSGPLYSIQRASCDLSTAARVWEGLGPVSAVDSVLKANPVLSGTEAVAWTEDIDPTKIVARIDDSLLCLTDTSAQLRAILSDPTTRATPSTDLTRVYYQYAQESESGPEVCFETKDILVSDADANVTRYNNGSKLVLESETESLSTCYRTSQGSLYFARLHQGDPNWTTSLLRASGDAPSLDIDYLGRTYVCDRATELIGNNYKDVIRCQTKAPGSASWTDFLVYQTPYAGTGGFPRVGAPSIVAARNDTGGQNRSAAYIAFSQYQPGVGPQSSSRIIIAKVNTAGVVYVETLHTVTGNFSESLASITAHPVPNQGYGLAVAWQSGSNLNSAIYCQKGGTLDQPQVTTKMSWSRPYNIAYAHRSRHPMLASTQDTIIAAWSEGDSGRILVRGQADDAEYDVWADTVNASLCPDTVCDYPQISVGTGDSTIVIFQKKIAADNYDVIANINLNTQLNLSDNGTNSTYPHCRFDLHQDSIPVVEAIWSEELGPTEDQVAYRHWLLGEQQGQGQQGSEIFDPSIVPMLFAPWPNPSHTQTNIRYQINRQGTVQLNIYDLTGRRITTLVTGTQRPGVYNLQWNRTDDRSRTVSNGIYFLRISAPALTSTRKLVVE